MNHFLLAEIRADVQNALDCLSIDDRMIAKCYYGINCARLSVEEIAACLCIPAIKVMTAISGRIERVFQNVLKPYKGVL